MVGWLGRSWGLDGWRLGLTQSPFSALPMLGSRMRKEMPKPRKPLVPSLVEDLLRGASRSKLQRAAMSPQRTRVEFESLVREKIHSLRSSTLIRIGFKGKAHPNPDGTSMRDIRPEGLPTHDSVRAYYREIATAALLAAMHDEIRRRLAQTEPSTLEDPQP
jgi:hypothetical protein